MIDEEDDEGQIEEGKEAKAKQFIYIKIFETDTKYGRKQEDPQDYAELIEQQLPVK